MVRIENPLVISILFMIIGAALLIIGYFTWKKPEKLIGVRFVRGFGGYNLSDKALWKSYQDRYGKEKAIKNMKLNGIILIIFGIIMLLFGIIKLIL